jgi:S-disulfanyl-L-cysteine oxidoreductase SoxD
MKIKFSVSVLLASFLSCGYFIAQDASEARSVWDGVYTQEQSRRGQMAYNDACSSCHGDSLKGAGEVPALSGGVFLSNWSGLPLGDLYERIRRTMPQDNPARASRQQKLDVLAYILSFNKFPAGKTELPRQAEILRQIRIEANKPEGKK